MDLKFDKGLLLTVLFLIGFGVVQVYSSSFIYAIESYGDGLYFFRRQLIFAFIAVTVLFITAKIPFNYFRKLGIFVWILSVIAVGLTLVPGLSVKVGGAIRWIQLPMGVRFQPAELLKYSFPLFLAFFIVRNQDRETTSPWYAFLGLICIPFVLLLKQPDFGTFVICFLVSFALLFSFGLKWRYLVVGIMAAVPAFYYLVMRVPYRLARVQAFLDPWADPESKGFQVIQSMLSFHSGGVFGVGLGQGQGKLFFLPEAHNDFTLAVLGEEMGFVGFLFVLLLYGYIIFRGLQVSIKSADVYSQVVSLGVTLVMAFSIFINVGVVMGLLPTKGLTLPFLSYGGSSLVCTCFGIGLLLNIEREQRGKGSRKFLRL